MGVLEAKGLEILLEAFPNGIQEDVSIMKVQTRPSEELLLIQDIDNI